MLRRKYLAASLIFAAPAFFSATAQEPKPPVPAQYAATAIGQAGAAAGKTFGLNIYIEGTTPNGDVDELIGILKQKEQSGVVSKLEDTKDLGRVAPTGSVGTGMRFVRIRPGKNGGCISSWRRIAPFRSRNCGTVPARPTTPSASSCSMSTRMQREPVRLLPRVR